MSKLYDNVYTVDEENSHRFYQIPKEFFVNETYRELNSDAKILYSVLLDRKELSRKNNWIDEHRQVYLIYTRENLADLLGISLRSVQRAVKLLNEMDLIKEERQGLNKPNRIYICRARSQSYQGHAKMAHQEVKNWHSSDTEYIETEKIKRYLITDNEACVFSYYNSKYKEYFFKDHPTVTKKQLHELEYQLNEVMGTLDIDDEQMMDCVDRHFEWLSRDNDGKIFSFLAPNGGHGVIYRYLEEE